MHNKLFILILIAAALVLTGALVFSKEGPGKRSEDKVQQYAGSKKILVVYFSHTGSTREVANQIHQAAGGDIFEIQAVNQYPDDYEAVKKIAKQELNSGDKPALKTKINNIRSYDIIFIGYPIWWGTFPAPVKTFLSEYDLSGKTVVPFSTHGGSGLGRSVSDISKLCPGSIILEGIAIWGNDAKKSQNRITEWLRKIKIINKEDQ